jgi:Uma2 family endonuclease
MKKITDISSLDTSKQYTYADYLTWQFSERVELIKVWLYKMPSSPSGRSPAPRCIHQKVEGAIFNKFINYLESGSCEVYSSSFDVRLIKNKGQSDKEINTVVQPDMCVICDLDKLDDAGCLGAPDLIVEILSDSTAKKDYNEKYYSLGLFNESEGQVEVVGRLFPELRIPLKTIFN